MFTRDSAVWWLAIIGSVITYLASAAPPSQWNYHQWIQAAALIVATISGKLATSPLPHSADHDA
jgi:hypothetical protein